ncbi:major facilitator superfamily transporter [Mycena olivaceomarginata]|nr:major facilitator superfamily transporter [Mycena olivaceomarginata]
MPGDVNEETALLSRPVSKPRTPLPKLQLSVILLIQTAEPLASQSIYPYINQVSSLIFTGGDEKKVGYYACQSLFFLTQATTVLQWSRASDRLGRKPILLIGLFGATSSIICFGLSRTFWALVASRCLCGLLSANTGVMKTAMGDLTDRTNRAEGFAYLPIVWAIGASLGPFIGGSLARPHDRFPELFSGKFWQDFPYFLPCLVTGSVVLLSFFVVFFFFKEARPLPLRELFIFPVIISISNYVTLAFLNTTLAALLPLRFGERRVFINGLMTCLPVFTLFPIMSMIARRSGLSIIVWVLVGCVLGLGALMDTSFGAVFMFVTAAAPKSSRGTVNGLSQTSVAIARAIGPAMSTSLFSFSVQHNLLGGYLVYLVLFVLSGFALLLAVRLPLEIWEDVD